MRRKGEVQAWDRKKYEERERVHRLIRSERR